MKAKHLVLILAALLLMLSVQGVSQAEIYKLTFHAFTTHQPGPAGPQQRMDLQVFLEDTVYRAPDALKSPGGLVVTAPDGSTFDMSENCWVEWGQFFFTWKFASDFSSQSIPSGLYKVTATGKNGKVLTGTDSVTVGFMNMPVVSFPANDSTLATLTPKLQWKQVAGATHYRITLTNESWREPVYSNVPHHMVQTNSNYFIVPHGVLLPKCRYSLRIEARDNDKDLDRRSRSEWITFFTP